MSAGPLRAAIGLSLRGDRRATLITFVTFGLRPGLPIVILYLVKVIIDEAAAHDTTGIAVTSAAIALLAGLAVGSISAAIELSTRMIESTAAVVDELLMELVSGLPRLSHLDDPEMLDRIEVLRQERVYLSEGGDSFSLVLGAAVRAAFTATILALVNPVLLLLPLLALPSLLAARRGRRMRAAAVERSAGTARLARHLYEVGANPAAGKELRLFGLGPHLRERYASVAASADREVTGTVWRSLVPTGLGAVGFAAGYLGALLFVLRDFARGGASLSDLVLVLGLVTSINTQMSQGIQYLEFLGLTTAASRRLLWLRDYAERAEAEAAGTGTASGTLRRGIALEKVGFRYPGGHCDALRGIDLFVPAGSVVVVVGVNGAGKSTLVKLLTGMYAPTSGRITVDGVDLAELSLPGWHRRVSACYQDFARLEFTAGRSVGLGDVARVEDPARVRLAVEQGAAAEVIAQLPAGLDSRLGRSFDNGCELSGGQWQRLALARSRMRDAPWLLLLDEPTAAIDPLAEDEVLGAYARAARRTVAEAGGITLLASHRLATARLADLVIVVDGGSIVQAGTHAELMDQQDGIYRELYEKQAGAYA